ncbi:MAG: AAA family ATPase [Nocardioidaceae bacterium]
MRVVTLTGPGGSGKTRLAIAAAESLVAVFPDGVYFVPLASVTSPDVMWTTIAEVLDVPPEGRIPPGFFAHVAHRTAVFVLDNLEQLPDADTVVAQLLAAAPQVVIIATSRRPLHVAAEHEHPVPPLELPEDTTLAEAEASGAVQLFVSRPARSNPASL